MTKKSENTVKVSLEDARAAALAWATPENLAWFDALTDEWFENARLVIPLKGRAAKRAA